jgi:hypothetical protein
MFAQCSRRGALAGQALRCAARLGRSHRRETLGLGRAALTSSLVAAAMTATASSSSVRARSGLGLRSTSAAARRLDEWAGAPTPFDTWRIPARARTPRKNAADLRSWRVGNESLFVLLPTIHLSSLRPSATNQCRAQKLCGLTAFGRLAENLAGRRVGVYLLIIGREPP